ncbi:MAG: hypothetical protein NZ729_02495 [Methylococcales bacterium]|nr:hypothetical protein [Methylococcales bacterium]
MTKGIDPAGFSEKVVYLDSFFRQESGVVLIRSPVFQVDSAVGDIVVPTDDVISPAVPELGKQGSEVRKEFELQCLPFRAGSA